MAIFKLAEHNLWLIVLTSNRMCFLNIILTWICKLDWIHLNEVTWFSTGDRAERAVAALEILKVSCNVYLTSLLAILLLSVFYGDIAVEYMSR